jgi:hypothetical protein
MLVLSDIGRRAGSWFRILFENVATRRKAFQLSQLNGERRIATMNCPVFVWRSPRSFRTLNEFSRVNVKAGKIRTVYFPFSIL